MSLIFLAADFPPSRGGIQTVAHELPLALQRAGREVGVVTVCREGAEAFDADCPYPVVRVPEGGKTQVAANLAAGAEGIAAQLSGRPEALIATKWFPEGLAVTWALRHPRPPVALIAHGREFRLHGVNVLKWCLQRFILRQMDVAFAVSQWTAGELARAGMRPGRVHVIHNGVRPERFANAGDIAALRARLGIAPGPVLLTVGRLVPRKGHADVIRVLPRVMERVGALTYLIAGEGPQEQALRDAAQGTGVAEHVRFIGAPDDDDLPTIYHLCDVFVMPTRELPGDPAEGFGIAYLEANAAGKPVIAARCGGVADAVEDGVSGLLLPPGDDDALVEAIVRLIEDRDLARRLGEGGLQRVHERFTWDHVAQRLLEGLEEAGRTAAPRR